MTSTRSFSSVAVDANALLSAAGGGSVAQAFEHRYGIEFLTTPATLEEARRYVPTIAKKRKVEADAVRATLDFLPIRVVEADEYLPGLAEASRLLRGRDPDDVPLLALALTREIPILSNDPHFDKLPVVVYSMARFLKILGI